MTPSAVNHQMLALEQFLGAPLFVRKNRRRLFLTDAGVAYQKSVAGALDHIARGVGGVAQQSGRRRIRLSVAPFVEHELLMPALAQLRQDHPELELEVLAKTAMRDICARDVDLVVRLGDGNLAGHPQRAIAGADRVMPVVARLLLQPRQPGANAAAGAAAGHHQSARGVESPGSAGPIWATKRRAGVVVRQLRQPDQRRRTWRRRGNGMWPLLRPDRARAAGNAVAGADADGVQLLRAVSPGQAQQPEIRAVIDWLRATRQLN